MMDSVPAVRVQSAAVIARYPPWHALLGWTAHVVATPWWGLRGALRSRPRLTGRRVPLDAAQRRALLDRLRRLQPLQVRVSAVNEPGAIRYARELRNVLQAAAWSATGVYKGAGETTPTGVALAVRNIVAPPGEARVLLDALRRQGTRVVWAHKPEILHDRTIEIQVGRLR
jgi:hypothetical protein